MNKKVHIIAFITTLIWGSGFSFTRLIGDDISPYSLCFFRAFFAASVLLILGKIVHIRKPFCKRVWIWFFVTGLMGFSLYYIFYNVAMESLTSATGSIITAASPILTSIGVYKFFGEKINTIGWISICTAFVGVVFLVMWSGEASGGIGILWMFISTVLFAVYNLLNRKLESMGYNGMEIVTYSAIWAPLHLFFFLPQTIAEISCASISAILSAIYLGLFPSGIAYYLWSKALLMTERTSIVSNYIFLCPLISTVLGFLLLEEVPDIGTFIGGGIIIISVIIFSLKGTPSA